jgi:hypothetical protein
MQAATDQDVTDDEYNELRAAVRELYGSTPQDPGPRLVPMDRKWFDDRIDPPE